MAEREQEQNRSEPATPFKLQEARKRGSVAKSLELNSLLAILGAILVAYLWGMRMTQELAGLNAALLSRAHEVNFEATHIVAWLGQIGGSTLHVMLPLFVVLVVIAVASGMMQTGPLFTTFPLKPDIKRLDPVAGLKRLFSKRALFDLAKNLVKIGLFTWVLYLLFERMLMPLLALLLTDPRGYLAVGFALALRLALILTAVLAFITLIDIVYTRVSYKNQLKMSRRELKEEVKNREGDPRIRQRVRELQKELVRRAKAIKRIPDADVLITNPTHLAVALLYKRDDMVAPAVIAKGAGEFADHMRSIARRHQVPIIENKELARALFMQVDLDRGVPQDLYPQVARILVRAYALRAENIGLGQVR